LDRPLGAIVYTPIKSGKACDTADEIHNSQIGQLLFYLLTLQLKRRRMTRPIRE
jgi:hypothetical protein